MNETRMTRDEAPLASMEDISQFNTPLPTPGPSPRSRHRWSSWYWLSWNIWFNMKIEHWISCFYCKIFSRNNVMLGNFSLWRLKTIWLFWEISLQFAGGVKDLPWASLSMRRKLILTNLIPCPSVKLLTNAMRLMTLQMTLITLQTMTTMRLWQIRTNCCRLVRTFLRPQVPAVSPS